MTNISLLHVSAPGCHPQRFSQIKRLPRWNDLDIKNLEAVKLKSKKLHCVNLCDNRSRFKLVTTYTLYAVCCKQTSVWVFVIRRDLEL